MQKNAEGLTDFAADALGGNEATHPAGLVALTAHARSGLKRLRLGATSAEIVATSTAPALVVPLTNGE